MHHVQPESGNSNTWLRKGAALAAAAVAGAVFFVSPTKTAQAQPYPIPSATTSEQLAEQARQTIQRQLALGIVNHLNPQHSEDGRESRVEIEVPNDGTSNTVSYNSGFNDVHPDALGRSAMANFDVNQGWWEYEPRIVLWAERDTSQRDSLVIMSVPLDEKYAAAVRSEAAVGKAPEMDILQTVVSDPGAVFKTYLLTAPGSGGYEYELGGRAAPASAFSVTELQKLTTDYAEFMRLGQE